MLKQILDSQKPSLLSCYQCSLPLKLVDQPLSYQVRRVLVSYWILHDIADVTILDDDDGIRLNFTNVLCYMQKSNNILAL